MTAGKSNALFFYYFLHLILEEGFTISSTRGWREYSGPSHSGPADGGGAAVFFEGARAGTARANGDKKGIIIAGGTPNGEGVLIKLKL